MKSCSNAFTMITPSFASAPPTFQINFSFSLICACLFERSLHPSWLGGKKSRKSSNGETAAANCNRYWRPLFAHPRRILETRQNEALITHTPSWPDMANNRRLKVFG